MAGWCEDSDIDDKMTVKDQIKDQMGYWMTDKEFQKTAIQTLHPDTLLHHKTYCKDNNKDKDQDEDKI